MMVLAPVEMNSQEPALTKRSWLEEWRTAKSTPTDPALTADAVVWPEQGGASHSEKIHFTIASTLWMGQCRLLTVLK